MLNLFLIFECIDAPVPREDWAMACFVSIVECLLSVSLLSRNADRVSTMISFNWMSCTFDFFIMHSPITLSQSKYYQKRVPEVR